ncbi:serine/threonine-protein kinase [Evansella vedderi]|uniref:non-specific serine/threonine protein kinase n=1 Tax=Evansella vedderi TaxID=38282 RepID=A0ABT9ZRB3_9BACI|nr:Stk1 family PASTA domain-containing Ser/Thr kinase [Evansella vedderi]MDQ0253770.1 serine/threonine-protein kinase [Evansella vedderi]
MNKRINDRYELLKPIGGGGMANVYLAKDIILDREVAIKVLKPQFSEDEEFIRRFRREAQAATSLSHPNVVNIYDVGEEDKIYYIVMEYVRGNTLKDYIQQKGKLHVQEAVQIMEQITSAIEHAHENHIIHRDIKPHNILLSTEGIAKVTDFGIARAISDATITHTNSVLGSVHYLSPEQARGGNVTYKSDIYSLGVVMYEMLTGEVPFNGDTAVSVAIKHLQEPLPFLRDIDPSIPQSVENVVLKATMKDPLDRFHSTDEMLHDLITVFDISRKGEKRVTIPVKDDEATKAVPIIGNDTNDNEQVTMVHGKPNDGQANHINTGNGKNKKNKKKSLKFWIITSLFTLFFILATMYVAFSLIPSWLHVEDVTIPDDLIGMEYEEAYEKLTDLKLEVEKELRFDEDVEEGHVISHNPRAGYTVKVGATVRLIVSEGTEPVEMVDVIGESQERAERILEDYMDRQYEYRESTEHDDDIVLDQSPEPGELVIPKETVVTLTLSKRPTVNMPNLYGMTQDEVNRLLSGNNMFSEIVFKEEHHPTMEEGKAFAQDPPRNEELRDRTRVTVTFSLGPEPEEEPEDQPITATVPFNVNVPEGNGDGEEKPTYRIRISVIDMMNTAPKMVVEEEISESRRFHVPLTVAPGGSGFLLLYVDGEEHEKSPFEYTYEELRQYQ